MPDKEFEKLLQDFLAYCRSDALLLGELEQPPLFFNAPEVKNLLTYEPDEAAAEEQESRVIEALGQINTMNVYRGSLVGYLIGLLAERGCVSPQTDRALAEFYLRVLDLVSEQLWQSCQYLSVDPQKLIENCQTDEDAEKRQELIQRLRDLPPDLPTCQQPELAQAWCAFSPLSYGMMSRLSASRELRDIFRQNNQDDRLLGICSLLSEWHEAVGYIPYMLDVQEEGRALLLSPACGRGVEIALRQIDTNNVMFTLLQFALYHQNLLEPLGAGRFEYRPLIEKIARHEPVSEEEWPQQLAEQGCFGYYNWRALLPDGGYDEMQTVWGEGNFAEIPKLNGQTVILLTRPRIQRSWGQAYVSGCHPNLRPSVEILRELEPNEVRRWLADIRQANAKGGA